MRYQYIPYIWPLMASALISLSLGVYALLKSRYVKGSTYFILLMFLVVIWTSGNTLEMSSTDFSTKLFWANIQYIAYAYCPVVLLALCMEFSGYDRWMRNRKVLLWIAAVPTAIILLVWTDTVYGLVRYDIHMDYSGVFPVLEKEYGPVFWVHAFYAYLLNISAWLVLMVAVFFKKSVYKKQALALFIGFSLTLIPNILYILGLSPVKRFDITAALFGPANLIIAWGIYRFKLFDVVPVARATLIENMDAGVMVLDLKDRILDINPAFEKIAGSSRAQSISKRVQEVCTHIPELLSACMGRSLDHKEFSICTNGLLKVYELFISPLSDNRDVPVGRLILIYDVTEKKRAQLEYLKQQRRLAVTEERARQARDMHDNLGQMLGFINLQAQGIRQELMNAGVYNAAAKLNKLINATQSAHQEIREYIRQVRSATLPDKEFMAALTGDMLSFEEQTGLKVNQNIPMDFTWEKIEPNVRLDLLNILKEALNNIRKHADARNVSLSITVAREQLCITVEDDGKGFEIDQPAEINKNKLGLKIMHERASEMGAHLEIDSRIGKGSRIALSLPLKEKEGADRDEIDVSR